MTIERKKNINGSPFQKIEVNYTKKQIHNFKRQSWTQQLKNNRLGSRGTATKKKEEFQLNRTEEGVERQVLNQEQLVKV